MKNKTIRLSGIVKESVVDGFGFRYVIFTQGCNHNCKGCHNLDTHDLNGGYIENIDNLFNEIKENELLQGVTYSGGEPLLQPAPLLELAKMIKKINLDLTIYTGFTYEELQKMNNPTINELLTYTKYLIDGRFVLEQRDLTLQFRGSKNQRIIDVEKTLKNNKISVI